MIKKNEKFIAIGLIAILIFSLGYFFFKNPSDKSAGNNKVSTTALTKLVKEIIGGEKVFLVLFQNNMELRPGGGYIGSFGIIKMENGRVKSYAIHDTSNFDGRIPDNNDMPFPMKKVFRINSWKLRDSNYSPDYPTNAKKALEFYYQGQGEEKFDGVIAVNAAVLESILKVTGPIKLEGYPNVFEADSALLTLEKQVEIDFHKQGISTGERKEVMNDFLKELLKKTVQLSKLEKIKLAKNLAGELKNKNIQLYFTDDKLKGLAQEIKADGAVDTSWSSDYLMVADTNIGAYKSDYFMKRSLDYSVDLTKEIPEATLKISYAHTGKEKNWMTRDYLTYLRLYVPAGSRINKFEGGDVIYGEDFNKKFTGGFIKVPINSQKTVEIKYILPKELKSNEYKLKIQKQSGSGAVPTKVSVKLPDGEIKNYSFDLNGDTVVN
ncbi:MAG TPA: hypothetical protein DDY52_01420 [Candidatus Moranbacteria bacterium]|nr:MAG: hypothetical protein UR51_C0007G0032 [Candidatus Moranbacteria bacterium GW2011_GWF1_34_10]HBI16804.1 hypothetical protein [Candidatus Moranbacteria bacterium]